MTRAFGKHLRRVSGAQVGARRVQVYVCQACGSWQVDHRGQPCKPDYFCSAAPCNGTQFDRFDSQAEARAFASLALRVKVGELADIELQPRFPLHAVGPDGIPNLIGTYVGDFRARDVMTGKTMVWDAKGAVQTDLSAWKIKHAEAQYGLEIRIIQL